MPYLTSVLFLTPCTQSQYIPVAPPQNRFRIRLLSPSTAAPLPQATIVSSYCPWRFLPMWSHIPLLIWPHVLSWLLVLSTVATSLASSNMPGMPLLKECVLAFSQNSFLQAATWHISSFPSFLLKCHIIKQRSDTLTHLYKMATLASRHVLSLQFSHDMLNSCFKNLLMSSSTTKLQIGSFESGQFVLCTIYIS